MSDVDIVDFKRDVYLNDSTRRPRALVSFGGETEIERIAENIVAYSLFDSDEIESIEEQLEAMIQRAAKGKLRVDSVNVEKRERRITYQFGRGYKMGRDEKGFFESLNFPEKQNSKETAKMKDDIDVSPVPAWINERIINPMLVPESWIDSVEVVDYRRGGFKVPSVDPVSLFLRPSFTIPLLSEGALCFGAKYYYDDEPVFSDPRFRLPGYRGVVYKLQGYASDEMNNCVRPVDTVSRFVTVTLRRSCSSAPVLKPLSAGQSLRNFNEQALSKLKRRIEDHHSNQDKPIPYARNFELVKRKEEIEKKEKKKKGLSFLKSRDKRKSSPPPAKLQKTKEDEHWKFGNSPERVKTECSSDEEVDKRTGQKRTKYRETKKTNDVSEILMEYGSRRHDEKEQDYKQIEREVHMKKSRKERGREFREKINRKFGFKPNLVQSDDSSNDDSDNEKNQESRSKRARPFML